MENLYKILQVDKNATQKMITKSYKLLAKKYHPDVSKNKVQAEEIMKKINAAYDILGDIEKRQKYDEEIRIMTQSDNANTYSTSTHNDNYYKKTTYNNTTYNNTNSNVYGDYSYKNYANKQRYNNVNNMYDYDNNNNNFEDYLNNFSFKKLLRIMVFKYTKITILLIFLLIINVLRVWTLFKQQFVTNNMQIENNKSYSNNKKIYNEINYNDEVATKKYMEFTNRFRLFQIDKLNDYISNDNKLTEEELYIINKNKNLILKIFETMTISKEDSNVKDYNIIVNIKRKDMNQILAITSIEAYINYNVQISDEQFNELLIDNIDKYDYLVDIGDNIKFVYEDDTWKIALTKENINNLFGYNIFK